MGVIIEKRKEKFKEVWLEKYRPDSLDCIVLDDKHRQKFTEFIKEGSIPSMLLIGPPGTGKTTIAYILIDNVIFDDMDFLELNGSLFRGIDVIRNLNDFLTSMTMMSKKKIIFIDEADKLTIDAQDSLRNIIEQNSDHVSFIFTANYSHKITDALKSRLQTYVFKTLSDNSMVEHIFNVLKSEDIKHSEDDVKYIINATKPDLRRCLNEINKVVFMSNDMKVLSLDRNNANFLVDQKFIDCLFNIVELKKNNMDFRDDLRKCYDFVYADTLDYFNVFEKLNESFKNIKMKTVTAKFYNEISKVVSPKMLAIEFIGEFMNAVLKGQI